MNKKIIVAGAGHGGVSAAAMLAEKGFDVTVYEKNREGQLGYDWTDIFDPEAITVAGMKMPPEDKFEYKTDMTFYSTNENVGITQRVPADELEIKMERKYIYEMLIRHAEEKGVKFQYETTVEGPLMWGDRVIGIKTDKGDYTGDMVIDACGCESPVRANLPACCAIQKHPKKYEKFFVYRAFYNKGSQEEVKDKYKVYLLPRGEKAVCWVASEDEYTDLLIGKFEPMNMAEVEDMAAFLRERNPSLGKELKRGGQFVEIPVRHPLAVLVCDGYAAIGDSAYMTVPIFGSGIGNSLKASVMLAETVMGDKTETYSAETLWDYQKKYYKTLGSGLAPLSPIKLLVSKITPKQLDFLFDENILTWRDVTFTAKSTELKKFIHITSDFPKRAMLAAKDPDLIKKLAKVVADVSRTVAVTSLMPKYYSRKAVATWAEKYEKIFK